MKKLINTLVISLLCFSCAYAQIHDDFADGELENHPSWQGDIGHFTINNNGQLQLNASEAGVSTISVAIDTLNPWDHDMEWHFWIRLAFSPSVSNFARFYLLADSSDLKSSSLHAYYLQFGENLAQDAIELFYTDGEHTVSVLRGTNALIASAFYLYVKIVRKTDGQWNLYVDDSELNWYHLHATGIAEDQFPAKAAGIHCKYTVSNITKFYFDDIYIGPEIKDLEKPVVTACYGNDDLRTVMVSYSEIVDTSGLSTQHYHVVENGATALACEYLFPEYRQVMLFFQNTFEEDSIYHLQINGIHDLAGNVIQDTVVEFHCHKIKRNDVLIHEIMADPTPVVGLPPVEYLELYNRTGGNLLLSNWKLQLGKTLKVLPDIPMPAHGYIVLAASEGAPLLHQFCDSVYELSSLSITDGGQELILLNNYDEVIHTVRFKDSWHRHSIKKEGGWSLEMIDTENPCTGEENWDSSIGERGGTPGRPNSIAAENADHKAPLMTAATVLDSNLLRVHFSETLIVPANQAVFTLDHDMEIVDIKPVEPYNKALDLRFNQAIQVGIIYQLTLNSGICDCAGLPAQEGQVIRFGLDESPRFKDLVINEILSDPPGSEDADYVEVYNRSEKIIDLKKVKIGSGGNELPDKTAIAVSDGYQLFPGKMVALCKNPKLTGSHYLPLYPQQLLPCDSLPAFANTSGVVHLTDMGLQLIDRLFYDEGMHYSMLSSTDGVSLERVHYDGETQDNNNWKSAAANVGFGTPGYRNSQAAESLSSEDVLHLEPEIISPDNDGFEDFAEIYCRFQDTENRVTVTVYAQNGLLIKKLANNETCGGEARFLWDGTDEGGLLAPSGLYVVKLQYWNLSGKRKSSKKVVGVR